LPIEGPAVIPSPIDSDYECIRIDVAAGGELPARPPLADEPEPEGARLCPEGYVPRRRRRRYELEGKRIRSSRPAQRNPRA
jgi:hypothetical protein